jgi:hypothetical protein
MKSSNPDWLKGLPALGDAAKEDCAAFGMAATREGFMELML